MGNSDAYKIGVVIATFNRAAYLKSLLQNIYAQHTSTPITVIPIVVIDGSTDNTHDMLLSEFPSVKIINGPGNWWWTKSVNEGMKMALKEISPDYVLILNDDSIIQNNYIQCLHNSIMQTDNSTIIGSISVSEKIPHRVSFSGIKKINWITLKHYAYHKNFELLENIPETGLFPTYALNGRGTLIPSAVLKELNFMNEKSFPQYGSDDDLALRAWKKGYKVLLSYSCKVYDRTNETSKGTAFRKDGVGVFIKSFFTWNSVNYIPKQLSFFYQHGIKILLPFYMLKFLLGTSNAYFLKYRKLKHEL